MCAGRNGFSPLALVTLLRRLAGEAGSLGALSVSNSDDCTSSHGSFVGAVAASFWLSSWLSLEGGPAWGGASRRWSTGGCRGSYGPARGVDWARCTLRRRCWR